jgi:hypothetical protein
LISLTFSVHAEVLEAFQIIFQEPASGRLYRRFLFVKILYHSGPDAPVYRLLNTSFNRSVTRAAGLVLIFFSSCPTTKKRPSVVFSVTY